MEVTFRPRAGLHSAAFLGAALALLGGCTTLPDVLPHAPGDEHELPVPEEVVPGRTRPATEFVSFRLQNGLEVVLLEDHAQPEVLIDTWFAVGARDECPGRRGFARLAGQLLARSSGSRSELAAELERGGGSVHVGAGRDRTRSFSMGPAALLPALLRFEAQRFAALHEPLAQAELERALDFLRAEQRLGVTRGTYGAAERRLYEALYPPEHPYHHALDLTPAGHADLEAATPADVSAFLREFFGPENAVLVVAGDFEPDEVRAQLEGTLGALPRSSTAQPGPRVELRSAPPLVLERAQRLVAREPVEFPKLVLAWPSPPEGAPGDAELDLLAILLAEGPSSRLEQRLVLDTRQAEEIDACQWPGELGSVFAIEAVAAPGADLEQLEREILAIVEQLVREGPSPAELARARLRQTARVRRRMESLLARAEAIQAYQRSSAPSQDGFARDLERWTKATCEDLRAVARAVLGPARVHLHILGTSDLLRSE